ncbi:MAG: ATP-binding protein [Spirosomaceae bacterium]|nr:ATP-binding protein [Spirosomataceae bacterium]
MASFIIVLVLISFLNKKIAISEDEQQWLKRVVKPIQISAIVLLVLGIVTDDKYNPTFNLFGFIITSVLIYILWNFRENKIITTLLLALLPFYIVSNVVNLISFFFHSFYEENDGLLSIFVAAALIWLIAYFVGASKQRKELVAEENKRKIIEEENRNLEVMVRERTSEILAQKNELIKTVEQLKATQDQLVQSEKLASLGELTAGIAHEIQNPLNFVNNFSEVSEELVTELLEERSKATADRDVELEEEILTDLKENLSKINHHGKRASGIVKSMLEHSRMSDGQKEPVDLNLLADEYLRLSYHGLRAKDRSFNAKMDTLFDPKMPEIKVITQDFGRVLLNIINNAFQSPDPSNSTAAYMKTVTVTTQVLANTVLISIKDNGAGIPENIKDKIFQPFFTTKPTGKGTGLGLSLAYDIVKAHGGEMKMSSKENEGTEFVITLPIQ